MAVAAVRFSANDAEIVRYLTHLRDRLADPEPAGREFAVFMRGEMKTQFTSEGRHLGRNPWKPLAPSTLKRKKRGQKILEDTHRLMRSLTEQTADSVIRVDRTEIEFGTRVEYAGFHQAGTRRMPARPIFGDYDELAATLGRIYQRHVFGDET